ncbi:unnamed protein product [Closterium sp. NIES-64]|nr:unnamed protein product [Closterium sp. NIES-64]
MRKGTQQGEQEGMVGDHEQSVQVLGRGGRVIAVAAAPPPLASAATVPAPAVAPVAPPLPSPAATTAAPAAATGTPALPTPAAAVTPPLLSPGVSVTAPAAAGGTGALPSLGVAVSPPRPSPAAAVTPLLSPAATTVSSQTAHAPPSPTEGDAAHGADTTSSCSPITLTLRNCTSRTPRHDRDWTLQGGRLRSGVRHT